MKRVVVFLILATVIFSSCATANPVTSTHWIVGTWIQEGGKEWVFHSNGTCTVGKEEFIYGISAGSEIYISNGWGARKIFLSPDGKKMVIMGFVFQKK